jgi:hypothetical protein|tara:strand:+ start:317 stop:622 length:306 start_codon:yes stop_codon:yes gene_type:complete
MGLFRELHRKLNLLITKYVLSERIRNRADKYFNRTLKEFKNKKHRKPDRNELFLLVVKTSHRVIGVKKAKGSKGHIKRQWIRKYLLLKNKIRDNFKIQKAR